jgi:hypothetical protein
LTIPLAYLTWRFVERPFRNKHRFGRKQVFIFGFVASLVLLGVGMLGHLTKGFEAMSLALMTDEQHSVYNLAISERVLHRNLAKDGNTIQDNGDCRFNVRNINEHESKRLLRCYEKYGKGIAILGDSHAIDLYGVAAEAGNDKRFLVGLTQGGCRPHSPSPRCQYENAFNFLNHNRIFSVVIFEQAGFYLLRTKDSLGNRRMFNGIPLTKNVDGVYPNEIFIDAVYRYLSKLSQVVPVVWFGPRTEPHFGDNILFRYGCRFSYKLREGQESVFRNLDNVIKSKIPSDGSLRYVSQIDMFHFDFSKDFMDCSTIFWSDGDHFSSSGEKYFAGRFDFSKFLDP